MAISNILDKGKYTRKTVEPCMKGSTDCMFLNENGSCRAEWCIFEELPEIENLQVTINCYICNTPKTVSAYSGERGYICKDCAAKIRALYTHTHPRY